MCFNDDWMYQFTRVNNFCLLELILGHLDELQKAQKYPIRWDCDSAESKIDVYFDVNTITMPFYLRIEFKSCKVLLGSKRPFKDGNHTERLPRDARFVYSMQQLEEVNGLRNMNGLWKIDPVKSNLKYAF